MGNVGERCWYCGIVLTAETRCRDHVIPKSRGGLGAKENRVWACRSCNGSKGARSVEELRDWLRYKRAGITRFTKAQRAWLSKHHFDLEAALGPLEPFWGEKR